MRSNRTTNAVVVAIVLVATIVFGFMYNRSVSRAYNESVANDKIVLGELNNEISDRLKKADPEEWKSIIEEYDNIHAEIRNEENEIVFETDDSFDDVFGVKTRTIFRQGSESYLLSITAFLFRDMQSGITGFIVINMFVFFVIISLIVLLIYALMLRPYRNFYRSIEEYDETGKFKKVKLHGNTGRLYDRFCRMAESQSRTQENQKRIIASISHDIKTPLTSIMGYSERLKNAELSQERKEKYIDTIYSKSVQISSIVEGFDEYLDYQLQNQLSVEEMTVDQLRTLICNEYADELEQNGVKFVVNCKSKRKKISIDVNKMRRVFGNIISNSMKHFVGDEKIIELDFYYIDETVYIKFSDNGEGVPEDKLNMIFDPLYTSDQGRKVAGLGLSICREIVEKHGGLIYAKPSDSGGLAVIIELKESKL